MAQELARLAASGAVPVDLARPKQGVRLSLPQELDLAGVRDSHRDGGRRFARCRGDELALPRRGDFQLDVDAIGKRAGNASAVARNALRRAAAAVAAISAMTARARVHRRDELETRRKLHLPRRPRNGYPAALDRLAQRLEDVAVEFRKLVQEQYAVVCERDFTRSRQRAAADESSGRRAVMRRAERPLSP